MKAIEKAWYSFRWWLFFLWPLMVLFSLISGIRRYLFAAGFKTSTKPAHAKVIVVGNISVGGNGKTPVVVDIAEYLQKQGWQPGILSRGYGGSHRTFPHQVSAKDSAAVVGDEPHLMAGRTGLPVVIDPQRARGAAFLADQCGCDVIICDDGLQHYALARDMEIVVMDERRYGNGYLMPMGPLREGIWRLDTVDAILHNVSCFKEARLLGVVPPQYPMSLTHECVVNVADPSKQLSLEAFSGQFHSVHGIAGIGNPGRFFRQLKDHGVSLTDTTGFADHYQYSAADIPPQTVIMTEKDAVKLVGIAHQDCWYVKASAGLPAAFYRQLDNTLRTKKRK
ncbi:tetraacyldisaccharide 4'-kinase [Salinimonas lutimaris]|uniref:tetraacyldisaccharide 4'-kinase n=1 Tax=Salinimonas lutimaris TaxID=914153 RepID=UPI0010C04D05|nr:tetraacyldisaccharide 4'-kinase [Salinimonas lutimaris]